MIAQLDQFETIRYSEHTAQHGTPVLQDAVPIKAKLSETVLRYDLRLQDVDALLTAVFDSSSVNPKFFVTSLNSIARKYLLEDSATRLAG